MDKVMDVAIHRYAWISPSIPICSLLNRITRAINWSGRCIMRINWRGMPTTSFVIIVRRSSKHLQPLSGGSRVSPLNDTNRIINVDIVVPAADGTQPSDAAFNLRMREGTLPSDFTRPINNLKRDADMYLGNVHTSFAVNGPGRYTRIRRIDNPLGERTDNRFLFVCFNDMETQDARRACINEFGYERFVSTTKSAMALCPNFFAAFNTMNLPEHEIQARYTTIGKAVWSSFGYDAAYAYDSTSESTIPIYMMSINPGE